MHIVSVNVGGPRTVTWRGTTVTTGIFKAPVTGPVVVRPHNLDGDDQADRSVHGGPTKAVYVYAAEHYGPWRDELGVEDLPWGSFGENLSVAGADEAAVCIGDEYRVGSARLVVTEPRMPCTKLNLRFERGDMIKRFLESRRSGFYVGVLESGVVQAGDEMTCLARHPARLSVADVVRLEADDEARPALLERAVGLEALPDHWRERFARRLDRRAR